MESQLYSVDATAALIKKGEPLALAGEAALLEKLPPGPWVGGTIPYFVDQGRGRRDHQKIHVKRLPMAQGAVGFRHLVGQEIHQVYQNAPENGYSLGVIPAGAQAHLDFALHAPNFPKFAERPLIGWISGVGLERLGQDKPAVFMGWDPRPRYDGIVVADVRLPSDYYARLDLVNVIAPGVGPVIEFPETAWSGTQVKVDGQPHNLASYLAEVGHDIRFPLVADYCGALINVSLQNVDKAAGRVDFYAPVFAGVQYRLAAPLPDYSGEIARQMGEKGEGGLTYNCILNYLYGELENKELGNHSYPCTFGEIAYQLVNQTLVELQVDKL